MDMPPGLLPSTEPIPGSLVFLRRPEPEDLPALHFLLNDPETALLAGSYGPPTSTEQNRDFHLEGRGAPDAFHLAVVERSSRATIGAAVVGRVDWRDQIADVGIKIMPSHRGRGLATDACRARDAFLFFRLGFRRLEWRCLDFNAGSRRLAESMGYLHEGVRRQVTSRGGRWCDEHLYALLRSDAEESTAMQPYIDLQMPGKVFRSSDGVSNRPRP